MDRGIHLRNGLSCHRQNSAPWSFQIKNISYLCVHGMIRHLMNINEIIKRRRLLLRITQQDLAELSGASLRTIKDIESGAANPSLHILSKIADILGMEVSLQVKDKINEAGGSVHK